MEQKEVSTEVEKPSATPTITFDDFCKIDLRVGQIMVAEEIAASDKLVRLEVELGEASGRRQIVAGIKKFYRAEELIGRKIVVVSNLKPRKMMGYESCGMLLAATDDTGQLELINPGDAICPGSTVG